MEVRFNLKGAQRKKLVQLMGEILEEAPKYLFTPTLAYMVDYFHVDKEGTVSFPDDSDREDVEYLFEYLQEEGYTPTDGVFSYPEEETEEFFEKDTLEGEDEPECEDEFTDGLTIIVPRERFSDTGLQNLENLLQAKGTLIKKSLGIPEINIDVDDEKVYFPWFDEALTSDEAKTYTLFISALCQMAQYQKWVSPKERQVANEKYTFRCFLLRLGFIGDDCKQERKILLQNFQGSSAFRGREYQVELDEEVCTFTAPNVAKAEEIAQRLAQEKESATYELKEVS